MYRIIFPLKCHVTGFVVRIASSYFKKNNWNNMKKKSYFGQTLLNALFGKKQYGHS